MAVSVETVQLAYDGEALRSGSMDVEELAPALLGIGKLCRQANNILNGDRAELRVKVRSDFQTGSFDLNIDVWMNIYEQARMLLTRENLSTAADIAGLLGFSASVGVGLFKLIKLLRGKPPKSVIVLESGNLRIEISDGDAVPQYIEVRPDVIKLYNDKEVREAVQEVVKPLEQPGIDKFQVIENNEKVELASTDDLPSFAALAEPALEEVIVDDTRVAALEIVKLSFDEKYKWMFSDGSGHKFNADLDDDNFLTMLANREVSFSKGDVLKVLLKTKSWRTEKGLRTEYVIERVLEIVPAPRQMSLLPNGH